MSSIAFSGRCACGRIRFQTSLDEAPNINWCYCITCQRQSGAPFIPFAAFMKKDVHWNQHPDIWKSSKIAERWFCKDCGSSLGMMYFHVPDRIDIPVCSMATKVKLGLYPDAHIFLKDKPAWVQVPDDGAERSQDFPSWYKGPTTEEPERSVGEDSE